MLSNLLPFIVELEDKSSTDWTLDVTFVDEPCFLWLNFILSCLIETKQLGGFSKLFKFKSKIVSSLITTPSKILRKRLKLQKWVRVTFYMEVI